MEDAEDFEFDLDQLSADSGSDDGDQGDEPYEMPDRATSTNMKALANQITRLEFDIKAKQKVAVEVNAVLDQEEAALRQIEAQYEDCRAGLEPLVAEVKAHPRGRNGVGKAKCAELDALTAQYQQLKARLATQRQVTEGERQVVLLTERELNAAERQLFRAREQQRQTDRHAGAHLREKARSTQRVQRREARGAAAILERQAQKAEARRSLDEQAMRRAEAQVHQAMEGNRAATARVKGTATYRRAVQDHAAAKKEEAYTERVEQVLQLKADVDAAAAQLRGANERASRRRRRKERAHAAEHGALLAQGQNPYAEFRKRDVDRAAERSEKGQRERIAEKERELVQRLVREDAYQRKQEAKAKRDKALEQAHRDALGRHVTEARTAEYLRLRTVGGRDIVDPAGKSHGMNPSQETVIKDHSFGLGKNPRKDKGAARAVVAKIKAKKHHRGADVGEFQRLVPRAPPGDDDGGGEGGGTAAAAAGGGGEAVRALDELLEPEAVVGADFQAALGLDYDEDAPGGEDAELEEMMARAEAAVAAGPEEEGGAGGAATKRGPRAPSKFERDALARAQHRQRARLEQGTVQVAGGRVFRGQAFIAKPARLLFKDFVVGEVYEKKVLITNVSLSFNSFKVLELDDAVKDFFEVAYERPGRMSAGTSCVVRVRFEPKLNEDVAAELRCLAETGPFAVPLLCATRKVVPQLDARQLDFGPVVMGETRTARLRVRNRGALPTRFRFVLATRQVTGAASRDNLLPGSLGFSSLGGEGEEREAGSGGAAAAAAADGGGGGGGLEGGGEAAAAAAEAALVARAAAAGAADLRYPEGRGAFRLSLEGEVGAYGEVLHPVSFAPLGDEHFRETYFLTFSGCGERLEVVLAGQGAPLPVFVAEPLVDLRCCVAGKLYRRRVLVRNRGKIAMQVRAEVPPALAGHVEFTPGMGYAQPGEDLALQMKFEPALGLLRQCGEHALLHGEEEEEEEAGGGGGGVLAVPVRLVVPDQSIPVYFTLRAQVTRGDVELSAAALDFGPCPTSQQAWRRLALRNRAALPQKFGFVQCPQELEVQPDDGFGVLLPGEAREVKVAFCPPSATAYDLPLTFRSSLGGMSVIRCRGRGVDPPLRISHTVLRLAPACPGDKVVESFFIKNTGKKSVQFEFHVPRPKKSHLQVAPAVGSVGPGREARVEVGFRPPPEDGPPGAPGSKTSLMGSRSSLANMLPEASAEAEASGEAEGTTGGDASGGKDERPKTSDKRPGTSSKKGGKSPKTSAKTPKGKQKGPTPEEEEELKRKAEAEAKKKAEEERKRLEMEAQEQEEAAPVQETEGSLEYSEFEPQGLGGGGGGGGGGGEAEPWSRHAEWKVLCFTRQEGEAAAAAAGAAAGAPPPPLVVEVATTTVGRTLAAEPTLVLFGQLAVGQTKVLPVRIRNHGPAPAPLRASGLNAAGCFTVVNALRDVPPNGGVHRLLVQFAPHAHGVRTEALHVDSPVLGKRLTLTLRGEGVSPALALDPPDGIVDLGHVLAGDAKRRHVTLTNTSVFPLTFSFEPLDAAPENYNHLPPFSLEPSQGEVAPGQDLQVSVLFAPDHERVWPFAQRLLVAVPNQAAAHVLRLSGRCWARQMYCVAGRGGGGYGGGGGRGQDTGQRVPESSQDRLALPDDAAPPLRAYKENMAKTLNLTPEATQEIWLKFPKAPLEQAGEEATMTVMVGCTEQETLKVGGQGTFEVELDEAARDSGFFTVTPDKGSVAPGKEQEVVFTFKPPQAAAAGEGGAGGGGGGGGGGLDVGQWFRAGAAVRLAGGHRPPGDGAAPHAVRVHLQGYIRI